MQRKDMIAAISDVSDALEKSGVVGVLRQTRSEKSAPRDTSEKLRALRDYAVLASNFKPVARSLAKILKLELLEDPEVWLQLVASNDSGMALTLARAVSTVQSELPKILTLLQQESVKSAPSTQDDATKAAALDSLRITFVEEDGRFSTVQRLVDGLSACQEIYDGLQRLSGDASRPLAIGAIDSGSDKSFDLFGAAALMKEFRELVVSLWGLVVFHREHKLGRRLELLASALPILERVTALEQANRLGREEAQIIKNCFIEGTKKFVAAGVLTEDLEAHATHNPRALLAPEPKLLTGPASADMAASDPSDPELDPPVGRSSTRNFSDADLERLAELMSSKSSRDTSNDDSNDGVDRKGRSDA